MSTVTIREDLKSFLESQDWVQAVYDYPEESVTGFPAIMVDSAGYDNEFNDTSRNMVNYKFDLYVLLSMKGSIDEKGARIKMDQMYDNLLSLFLSQVHFSGSIKTQPIRAERPSVIERPGQMMMGKFTIEFLFLTSRLTGQ